MVMYENDDDSESDDESTENLFEKNENPYKILCFVVVEDSEEIHALVQSCHKSNHKQDSILFQHWKKNT